MEQSPHKHPFIEHIEYFMSSYQEELMEETEQTCPSLTNAIEYRSYQSSQGQKLKQVITCIYTAVFCHMSQVVITV